MQTMSLWYIWYGIVPEKEEEQAFIHHNTFGDINVFCLVAGELMFSHEQLSHSIHADHVPKEGFPRFVLFQKKKSENVWCLWKKYQVSRSRYTFSCFSLVILSSFLLLREMEAIHVSVNRPE